MRPDLGQDVSPITPTIFLPVNCRLSSSTEVDVHLWEIAEYQGLGADLPAFIDPDWITRQVGITTISIGENGTKVWATVDLVKVCNLHITLYLFYDLCLQ